MRVLVTGASGFLGSHIASRLLDAGFDVVGASRGMGYLSQVKGVKWKYLDITSWDSLCSFDFSVFDCIVHNAGITYSPSEDRYFEINYLGTRYLVKRLETVGFEGRFILISSLAVHGPGRAKEDDIKLFPITPYGISKLMGEQEVRGSFLNWYVIRPPVIFGERDRALVGVYRLFSKGVVPVWKPSKRLSVVYAGNVAEAVRFLVDYSGKERVFLIKDTTLTWEDFALKVQEILNVKPKIRVPLRDWMVDALAPVTWLLRRLLNVPLDRYKLREIKAREWVVDTSLLEGEGYSPVYGFEDALGRTLSWCRSRKYL